MKRTIAAAAFVALFLIWLFKPSDLVLVRSARG
jgi:hypothetical protein